MVEVEYRSSPDVWPALVDENQLELALVNLVINARDAMPTGGVVTVEAKNCISTQQEDLTDGNYVVISVIDTGMGIAAEDLPLVFDPFFTTKDVGKGTGLGLSMVYGFAEQSGGRVLVQSELGKGTSFELWLPRADASGRCDRLRRRRCIRGPACRCGRTYKTFQRGRTSKCCEKGCFRKLIGL